jgi:hypothetical protein
MVETFPATSVERRDDALRDEGGLAVRMLRTAVECAVSRDAARANVVLAFERDAARRPPRCAGLPAGEGDAADVRMTERTRGLMERVADLALRVADVARLSARRGAPEPGELDRLCRLGSIAAVTSGNLLRAEGAAREPLADVLEELLLRAERSATRAAKELQARNAACLAC